MNVGLAGSQYTEGRTERQTVPVAKPTTAVFQSLLIFSPLNSLDLCYMYGERHLVGNINEYHTARMEFGRVRFSKELLYSPTDIFLYAIPTSKFGMAVRKKLSLTVLFFPFTIKGKTIKS